MAEDRMSYVPKGSSTIAQRIDRRILKGENQKINLMKAEEPVPHLSKTIHERNRWMKKTARASKMNYHRVPSAKQKKIGYGRTQCAETLCWKEITSKEHKEILSKERPAISVEKRERSTSERKATDYTDQII